MRETIDVVPVGAKEDDKRVVLRRFTPQRDRTFGHLCTSLTHG